MNPNVLEKTMEHRVLIVEDDPSAAKLLAAAATSRGFSAEVVGDGDAALKRLWGGKWDVILLDLLLPRMNGFELLRHFKCTNPVLLQKTIVVTGAAEATTRDCSELRSVWRFMRKPVDLATLTAEMLECARQPGVRRSRSDRPALPTSLQPGL